MAQAQAPEPMVIEQQQLQLATVAPVASPPFPPPQLAPGTLRAYDGNQVLAALQTGRTWRIVKELRECIYGNVQLAIEFHRNQDNVVEYTMRYSAVKVILRSRLRKAFPPHAPAASNEDPLKEISVMQHLTADAGHPNVLSIEDALQDENAIYIVMPYCDGGELFDVVANSGRFLEAQARPLFRQLLQGMAFLQRRGVCHRDLSLENILVSDGSIVIIDFGMSLRVPQTGEGQYAAIVPSGSCGKRNYMSPEIFTNGPFHGFAIDTWAAGIILFIMLTGVPPFDRPHRTDARFRMIAMERRLAELLNMWHLNMSEDAVELLQRILVAEPLDRPNVAQLASHPWVLSELH